VTAADGGLTAQLCIAWRGSVSQHWKIGTEDFSDLGGSSSAVYLVRTSAGVQTLCCAFRSSAGCKNNLACFQGEKMTKAKLLLRLKDMKGDTFITIRVILNKS